jgi:hypothetical protein
MAFQGAAVLSRIWHQNIDTYKPLTYVHLLVQPSLPLDADVQFSTELEDTFAAVLSLPQADIIDNLLHAKTTDDPITRGPALKASDKSWEQLANAHYDLMMQYKFVIPENAKQEEILFDAVTAAQPRSQHRDYIAAVCDVRYNWVFDPKGAPGYDAGPLTPAATYHDIDVHRHITHLQSSSATSSNFLKKLSTGWYVLEIGGAKRRGVIVFDVKEHGRYNTLFKGQNDPQPTCHDLCETFGTGGKASNTQIELAMLEYFKPPTHWSLCDMAYKYVIYDTASPLSHPAYFMRDSFELERDPMNSDTASACSFCPFCPACFEAQPDTLGAGGTTMYHHIKT